MLLTCRKSSCIVCSYAQGCTDYPRSRQRLKILGARSVKCFKCHAEDPFTSGVTVQNSVAMAALRPGFVHPLVMRMAYLLTKIRNAKRSLRTPSHTVHTDFISRSHVGLHNKYCICLEGLLSPICRTVLRD
jgi:hypothetical protein